MLNKLYAFFVAAFAVAACNNLVARTVEIIRTEPAPVLTTVYDDNHEEADAVAERKDKEAMRMLNEAQEAHNKACKLATQAAAEAQRKAVERADAARKSYKKALGAQQAANAILTSRSNVNTGYGYAAPAA